MSAVWLRARAELRSRLGATFVLALTIGVAAGVVLAALAGARRTMTAYPRALVAYDVPDAFVVPTPGQRIDLDRVEALPQVRRSARFAFMALARVTESGELAQDVFPFALVGGALDMGRPIVLAGREPRADRPDEVAVNPGLARRLGLRPGSTLRMAAASPAEARYFIEHGGPPPGFDPAPLTLRVVGITAALDEAVQDPRFSPDSITLTPAYFREHRGSELFQGSAVELVHGDRDLPAFQASVERLTDQPVPFVIQREINEKIQRAIRPQAAALLLFGAFGGLVALLVLGQALGRSIVARAGEERVLRSIGMTRRQLAAVAAVHGALVAVAAGAVALGGAVALSPLAPVGIARRAEPAPGVNLDAAVLLPGVALLMAAAVLRSALASPERRGPNAARLARGRGPTVPRAVRGPSALVGLRMAADGSGHGAVTRGAALGVALALASIGVAYSFGHNLDRVERTPRLYGADWDVEINGAYGPDIRARVGPRLAGNVHVSEFSSVSLGQVTVASVGVGAMGVDPERGSVLPPVLEGRAPRAPDEVALGVKTFRRTGRRVGDETTVAVGGTARRVRIVGRAVVPSLGLAASRAFGEGALFTVEGLRRLVPDAPVNVFFVRLASGAAPEEARRSLPEALGVADDEVATPALPAEIANLLSVGYLPYVLAALLALLAAATLQHAIATTSRAREREVAVLKALGFVRRQVRAAFAVHASAIVVVAAAAGVPAGLAAGRWAWTAFAEQTGLVADPAMTALPLVLAVPASLAIGNVIAALPGAGAARVRPAALLRTE